MEDPRLGTVATNIPRPDVELTYRQRLLTCSTSTRGPAPVLTRAARTGFVTGAVSQDRQRSRLLVSLSTYRCHPGCTDAAGLMERPGEVFQIDRKEFLRTGASPLRGSFRGRPAGRTADTWAVFRWPHPPRRRHPQRTATPSALPRDYHNTQRLLATSRQNHSAYGLCRRPDHPPHKHVYDVVNP